MHARLSEFYGKNEEDVTAWYEKVERVARVNNWEAGQIHTIVVAYLKEAAADYFEDESGNVTGWIGGNTTNNLKDLLIAWFASDSIKDV